MCLFLYLISRNWIVFFSEKFPFSFFHYFAIEYAKYSNANHNAASLGIARQIPQNLYKFPKMSYNNK